MLKIKDDKGYNQGFTLVKSTEVRLRRRAQAFIEAMDSTRPLDILEIGCGTGELAYWTAEQTGMSVLGTDICKPFIEQARSSFQLPNLQYEVIDFNQPETLTGKKFDYIIGNGILHHLYYSIEGALGNIHALLKPTGSILFYEPNIYNPYCALIFNVPYLRAKTHLEPTEKAFSKNFISRKLQKMQFREIVVCYKDFLLPGVPDFFIRPLIVTGDIVERIPVLNMVAQSLFITAKK